MAGEEISQEQTDEIKLLIHTVMEKICAGEAPAELIALYQNMTSESFGYWLHGFYCGFLHRKELYQSEILKFLKRESEGS